MSDAKTIYDFEFHFLHGEPAYFPNVEDGRWSLRGLPDGRIVFQVRQQDETIEELSINPVALAYMRSTKREVPAEAQGSLQ